MIQRLGNLIWLVAISLATFSAWMYVEGYPDALLFGFISVIPSAALGYVISGPPFSKRSQSTRATISVATGPLDQENSSLDSGSDPEANRSGLGSVLLIFVILFIVAIALPKERVAAVMENAENNFRSWFNS